MRLSATRNGRTDRVCAALERLRVPYAGQDTPRGGIVGAAALEALSEHGILGQVSHLSSVSGGSLASSYFLSNPPACVDTANQEEVQLCWQAYFSEFKGRMRLDYQAGMMSRNARPTRFTSPTRRVTSLQESLDKNFLHGKTFGELDSRPVPNNLPVSLAVVASASFPPAIGPVSIQAPSACDGGEPEWWHLGDGGTIENSGVDSLEEVVLRRLTDTGPPLKKALILSVDAGANLDPDELKRRKNFKMYSTPSLVNLVVISARERGQAFHDMFWDELSDELATGRSCQHLLTR